MQHPALEDLLDPIRVLYDDVRKKVLQNSFRNVSYIDFRPNQHAM